MKRILSLWLAALFLLTSTTAQALIVGRSWQSVGSASPTYALEWDMESTTSALSNGSAVTMTGTGASLVAGGLDGNAAYFNNTYHGSYTPSSLPTALANTYTGATITIYGKQLTGKRGLSLIMAGISELS